jgi:hypothetical protein
MYCEKKKEKRRKKKERICCKITVKKGKKNKKGAHLLALVRFQGYNSPINRWVKGGLPLIVQPSDDLLVESKP